MTVPSSGELAFQIGTCLPSPYKTNGIFGIAVLDPITTGFRMRTK